MAAKNQTVDDTPRITTRTQLSLYVPPPKAAGLESVRQILDPLQHSLIPAHVTLCREDEIAQLTSEAIAARILDAPASAVTLVFGRPKRFQRHGILLPCIAGESAFTALRMHILGSRTIRRQSPHITLAHPHNPKTEGNCLANAERLPAALSISFTTIRCIQQMGGSAWRVLHAHALKRNV